MIELASALTNLPWLAPFPTAAGAVLLALAIAAYAGDLDGGRRALSGTVRRRWLPTPHRLTHRLALAAERRLNRPGRGRGTLRVRGALVAILFVAGAMAAGWMVAVVARGVTQGWMIDTLLLLSVIGGRRAWNRTATLAGAVGQGERLIAERALADAAGEPVGAGHRLMVRGHDLHLMDPYGLVRLGVEELLRMADRGIVAPCLWYLVAGLPALMVWSVLKGLDDAVGGDSIRRADFGRVPGALFAVMGWVPSRLTAALLVAAALAVPAARPGKALTAGFRFARQHPSPNLGWPMAATAGALDLSLGGPWRRGEVVISAPWVGDGRARARPVDLMRARALVAVALLLSASILSAAAAVSVLDPDWPALYRTLAEMMGVATPHDQ